MELSRKSCLVNLVKVFLKLLHGTVMQTLPYEVFLESLHATVVQRLPPNYFLKLLHGTVVQKLPSKLFLKLLFGTVVQKLCCEAIAQGKISISISGRCYVFLSNGKGLGRSLSYVGRNQISLVAMLRGSVVHKLPFAGASEAFAWNRSAKVAFQSYHAGLAWNCRTKVGLRWYFCKARLIIFTWTFVVLVALRSLLGLSRL